MGTTRVHKGLQTRAFFCQHQVTLLTKIDDLLNQRGDSETAQQKRDGKSDPEVVRKFV
jgi:hypothetical protein